MSLLSSVSLLPLSVYYITASMSLLSFLSVWHVQLMNVSAVLHVLDAFSIAHRCHCLKWSFPASARPALVAVLAVIAVLSVQGLPSLLP